MSDRRTEHDYESDELFMNDEIEFDEVSDDEELQEERGQRSRVNMDMRHRIEDRLEERRLKRELNDYEFFEVSGQDEDILH